MAAKIDRETELTYLINQMRDRLFSHLREEGYLSAERA